MKIVQSTKTKNKTRNNILYYYRHMIKFVIFLFKSSIQPPFKILVNTSPFFHRSVNKRILYFFSILRKEKCIIKKSVWIDLKYIGPENIM